MKILIIGVDSQNGYYLSKYIYSMCSKNVVLHGTSRRTNSLADEYLDYRHTLDLDNRDHLWSLLEAVNPDQIYMYAANSKGSEKSIYLSKQLIYNFNAVLTLVEWILESSPSAKLFYASSVERYGDTEGIMSENTDLNPINYYGLSKSLTDIAIRELRKIHHLNVYCGIFFNNESFLRDISYFSKRIISDVREVAHKRKDHFDVFAADVVRDWSHTLDFVKGAWWIMNKSAPGEYIFASGKGVSIREFAQVVCEQYGIDYERYAREKLSKNAFGTSPNVRIGDNGKLLKTGWFPEYDLSKMIVNIIDKDNLF